jgi:hypothetical protein
MGLGILILPLYISVTMDIPFFRARMNPSDKSEEQI